MKTLILIAFLLSTASAEAADTKRYCYSEDLFANSTPLGKFQGWLEITPYGHSVEISFEDKMPDAAQYIFFDDVIARHVRDSIYTFRFEDNWENRGSGRLRVSGEFVVLQFGPIVPTKDSVGRNATRGYSDMILTQKACSNVPRFSHPW